jgi:hypothetical protein
MSAANLDELFFPGVEPDFYRPFSSTAAGPPRGETHDQQHR